MSTPCAALPVVPVTQAWSKVLPDRVYKRAMGALLSLAGGKICTPVLGAQDLGEEQTHALHRIFKTLGEAVRTLVGMEVEVVIDVVACSAFARQKWRRKR